MSPGRSLWRVSILQASNYGLDGAVVEANNICRIIDKGGRLEAGLSVLENYTQVYNGLKLI